MVDELSMRTKKRSPLGRQASRSAEFLALKRSQDAEKPTLPSPTSHLILPKPSPKPLDSDFLNIAILPPWILQSNILIKAVLLVLLCTSLSSSRLRLNLLRPSGLAVRSVQDKISKVFPLCKPAFLGKVYRSYLHTVSLDRPR